MFVLYNAISFLSYVISRYVDVCVVIRVVNVCVGVIHVLYWFCIGRCISYSQVLYR